MTNDFLRPDNCDGSYEEYCDSSREYSNITSIIEESGNTQLLSYMQEYWKDYEGDDETFWEHEWNKHGMPVMPLLPYLQTNSPYRNLHQHHRTLLLYRLHPARGSSRLPPEGRRPVQDAGQLPGASNWSTFIFSSNRVCLQALSAAGITPSTSKTYTLDEIHSALGDIHDGYAPYVSCDSDNLNEIWYFYNVRGNLITGEFEPTEKCKLTPISIAMNK